MMKQPVGALAHAADTRLVPYQTCCSLHLHNGCAQVAVAQPVGVCRAERQVETRASLLSHSMHGTEQTSRAFYLLPCNTVL